MINRLSEGFRWARRLEDERGGALVELAISLTVLLILVFGLIDFSQMIYDKQMMSGLTRQGSDLASRGTTLTDTVTALGIQGAAMKIGTNGRIIVTAVGEDTNGNPQIEGQAESPTGIAVSSAIGTGVGNRAHMPSGALTVLNTGQWLYVTEVFYAYSPMTPVGSFLKTSLTPTLYEAAYF